MKYKKEHKNGYKGIEKSDSLAIYLRDINNIPLLSADEEKKYIALAKKGDKVAKEKLINSNLRFVVKVAKQYRNSGLSFSDLISEGNIGLTVAVDRVDPSKDVHFISYAVWWIRQSILKAISEKSHLIRLPVNRQNELSQIEEKMQEKREQNIEEVASSLKIDRSVLASMMAVSHNPLSLDSPIQEGDKNISIGELIKDDVSTSPEGDALYASLKDDIAKLLSTLTNREASILKYRFGLEGEEPHSLLEVGMNFNLTKERIRQIEKKSIEKLKSYAKKIALECYVA